MITVAIADDHQMFTDGIQLLLDTYDNISCIGSAQTGDEILLFIEKNKPNVVLLDINMPGNKNMETLVKINENYPEIRVLMLSMHNESALIRKAIESGAHGFILKDASVSELGRAIESVYNGNVYYSEKVTKSIMESLVDADNKDKKVIELTARERDVLQLIVNENTTHEIADKLFISQSTVITHRRNLLRKTESRNTAGLVKFALQEGIYKE